MTQQPPRNDYGYRAYGERSHFVYCLLQKIKASGSLPVIEQWESYMLPNHSSFAASGEEHFLVGTHVHAALEKMTSQYLKKEFRSSARRFLEDFTSTVLSTVAARSKLGQGVSCFWPEIIIGGDDHSAFFLIGQLVDGSVACGWEKGSTVEACKAEFQSIVNDQRQLECHASRKLSDISNVLSYLTHRSGFRSRRHLYRVSLVGFHIDFRCDQRLHIAVSLRSSNWQHYFNVVLQKRYPDFTWTLTASLSIIAQLILLSAACRVLYGTLCPLSRNSLQTMEFQCCWVL